MDFGINIETGFVERGVTVVFSGVRDDTERDIFVVVFDAVFVRDTLFSPRTADSADVVQIKHRNIKSKNFFISEQMLANL